MKLGNAGLGIELVVHFRLLLYTFKLILQLIPDMEPICIPYSLLHLNKSIVYIDWVLNRMAYNINHKAIKG